MSGVSLSAPCFTKASNDLYAFVKTNPFETGFLGVPAQSVPNSSVGLLANGKAAMELQGDWDPAAGAGLTPDKSLNSKLGWFPFPSVPGGAGDPKAVLGGGDGYSCTTGAAEPACAQFLQYLTSPAVQKQIIGAGVGLPANPAAADALDHPRGEGRGGGELGRAVHRRVLRHRAAHHARPEPGQRGGEVVRQPGRHRDRPSSRRSPRRVI